MTRPRDTPWVAARGARSGGRLNRRSIVLYVAILAGSGVTLAIVLPIGQRIVPAPTAPETGTVRGPGRACLGERVVFDQSGVFLALRDGTEGAADAATSAPLLVEGRIDRHSGSGVLRGHCASGARLASRPVELAVSLDRKNGSVSAVLRAATGPVQFQIEPVAGGGLGPKPGGAGALTGSELAGRLLLAVAVVMAAARLVGSMLTRVRQPRVIGEIVAGILLGPSLLGVVAPDAVAYLFPPEIIGAMRVLAQLGLVFFMFLIGLELDLAFLRRQARSAVLVSHNTV